MKTTAATITNSQIRELRDEAKRFGDEAQAEICIRALYGDEDARVECARVISDAEMNATDDDSAGF